EPGRSASPLQSRETVSPSSLSPQIWPKSQTPCPKLGLQGACAKSASVGSTLPVSSLFRAGSQRPAKQRISLPILDLPSGIQPESNLPSGWTDGAGLSRTD